MRAAAMVALLAAAAASMACRSRADALRADTTGEKAQVLAFWDQYHAMERSYGQFVRSFSLPDGADSEGVKAELKDGVLTVHVGKRPEVQPKKIAIGKGAERADKS